MSKFPWFKNYPDGIPEELGDIRFDNIIDMLDYTVNNHADKVAFENFGTTLTFREVNQQAIHFAAYLQSVGMKKGDRIAIQMPNLLQYPIALFGAIKAGLIVVNTNPLYTPREMAHQFKDSGVTTVVVLANFAKNLQEVLPSTSIKHVIVTEIGDLVGGLKGPVMNFVVKRVKKMVPAYSIPSAVSFKRILSKGSKEIYTRPAIGPDDNVFLQYTGGTTGVSKGAQLSHRNIVAHTIQINHWFKPLLETEKQETIVTAIPMYHIFALAVNGVFGFFEGMKNVLITNPRDMNGFIKELSKQKCSIITGVNTLFNGMMNNPGFKDLDFSSLKVSLAGGMALQDFVARKWTETTNTPLVEGYGLSETSPVLSCNPLNGTHRMGTIGVPTPGTEMAILDEEGNFLPQGEVGEICARGPQVMAGYWNRDKEGVFFHKDWFRTGDMGIMEPDGFFRIVDRKKDMINVSGFNVFPNEVENVVVDHPKVLEVAAIGVPHPKSNECVKVFVVKSDESLTEEELLRFCEENLTGYKVPKHIEFRKELPKSNVGKILRRVLKEEEEAK
ncbi:MAG: AMP-binding protein [Cyclobacteriaceae bacterium]|nr:AMP-binding protein [Cyclobacteriaceae bacterium]